MYTKKISGDIPQGKVDNDPDELYDVEAAAVYLGGTKPLNPGTLRVWISTKRYDLPFVKIGGSVRFRRSDLDKFILDRLIK